MERYLQFIIAILDILIFRGGSFNGSSLCNIIVGIVEYFVPPLSTRLPDVFQRTCQGVDFVNRSAVARSKGPTGLYIFLEHTCLC